VFFSFVCGVLVCGVFSFTLRFVFFFLIVVLCFVFFVLSVWVYESVVCPLFFFVLGGGWFLFCFFWFFFFLCFLFVVLIRGLNMGRLLLVFFWWLGVCYQGSDNREGGKNEQPGWGLGFSKVGLSWFVRGGGGWVVVGGWWTRENGGDVVWGARPLWCCVQAKEGCEWGVRAKMVVGGGRVLCCFGGVVGRARQGGKQKRRRVAHGKQRMWAIGGKRQNKKLPKKK